MALVLARKSKSECVALAAGDSILVAESTAGAVQRVDVGGDVTCAVFSRSGKLLAACTEDKRLRVWETPQWRLVGERQVVKRATSLQISEDDSHVLLADKSGEVFKFAVRSLQQEGQHLLGHLSMLLAMCLPPGDSHVITADRDEKIRVSRHPNCYHIQSYCLGHSEFVSQLCLCPAWPELLISASGDGTLRSWHWADGTLLHTQRCSHSDPPLALTLLACSHHDDSPLVVAAVESSQELLVFRLTETGTLLPSGLLALPGPPLSLVFDSYHQLWVSCQHCHEPLHCYQHIEGKFCQFAHPLLTMFLASNLPAGATSAVDWSQLRKHSYDNVGMYLARKAERVQQQKLAREGVAPQEPSTKTPRLENCENMEDRN